MKVAQWVLIGLFAVKVVTLIYCDIEGREYLEPKGFRGVLGTLMGAALLLWLYVASGITPWDGE